jgi:hypothetical protein
MNASNQTKARQEQIRRLVSETMYKLEALITTQKQKNKIRLCFNDEGVSSDLNRPCV